MQKLFLGLSLLILSSSINAQPDTIVTPPYKRFPSVPPLNLLQTDSVSFFTKAKLKKNKPVLIMLFSPECDHCRHETEEIIKHIDDFKKIQIVMATTMPFDKMKQFHKEFELSRFENISVGKDINYILPIFYDIRNLPFLAFYDKNGKLKDAFEGMLPIKKMLAKFE